jgi:hypothetical protein
MPNEEEKAINPLGALGGLIAERRVTISNAKNGYIGRDMFNNAYVFKEFDEVIEFVRKEMGLPKQ